MTARLPIWITLLIVAPATAQISVEVKASEDVWVYGRSLNPAYDPLLRIWGDGVDAIHPCPPDDYHSFAYVRFALPPDFDPTKSYNVTTATLTVTQQFDPGYTLEEGQAHPLRAYSLGGAWSEATWDFSQLGVTEPCPAEPFFGEGDLSQYQPTTVRFPIPIDLLGKGSAQFNAYFNAALKGSGKLDLALCSLLAPTNQTDIIFYKILSRDHSSGLGPVIKLLAEPAAKQISGSVNLEAFKGDRSTVTIAFQVRKAGNTLESHNVPLSESGAYSFSTSQSGVVDVTAKGTVWLRQLVTVNLGGTTTGVGFDLTAGDVDSNNAVDLNDLTMELVHFAEPGPLGDANGDSSVDLLDLSLSLVNFGLTGVS